MNPSLFQRGFSIPAAIFIIVILAALGAFLATIGSGQQLGHAQDVTGTHALQAARTGIEWGVYQTLNQSASAFTSNCRTGGSSSDQFSYSSANGQAFRVLVECRSSGPFYDGASPAFYSYLLTATACSDLVDCPNTTNPSNFYVERRVTTLVIN